jgi:hypothetical protein
MAMGQIEREGRSQIGLLMLLEVLLQVLVVLSCLLVCYLPVLYFVEWSNSFQPLFYFSDCGM